MPDTCFLQDIGLTEEAFAYLWIWIADKPKTLCIYSTPLVLAKVSGHLFSHHLHIHLWSKNMLIVYLVTDSWTGSVLSWATPGLGDWWIMEIKHSIHPSNHHCICTNSMRYICPSCYPINSLFFQELYMNYLRWLSDPKRVREGAWETEW